MRQNGSCRHHQPLRTLLAVANTFTNKGQGKNMATSVLQTTAPKRVRRRPDRFFFYALALIIAATVLLGFAKTYFLAGFFAAKLPSALVHIHGALFTSWIGLLATQIILISLGRVRWHMRLGTVGMFLAPLMVIVGFATLFAAIHRRPALPLPVLQIITAADILTLCIFAGLILWAFLARHDAAAHKRLMLLATITILGPAVGRWPFAFVHSTFGFLAVLDSFLALLILYDLWTRRSLHRTTVWGLLLTIGWQTMYLPFAKSAFMHQLVAWVQRT